MHGRRNRDEDDYDSDDDDDEEVIDGADLPLAAVPVLQRARWPSPETLHLDESQLRAVQTALTKRIAIVQASEALVEL